jgi:hypothetical protein
MDIWARRLLATNEAYPGDAANRSRSHDSVIGVYDDAGNVSETHDHGTSSESGKLIIQTVPTKWYERSQWLQLQVVEHKWR